MKASPLAILAALAATPLCAGDAGQAQADAPQEPLSVLVGDPPEPPGTGSVRLTEPLPPTATPDEVVEAFYSILYDGASLVQDDSLSHEELCALIEEGARGLSYILPWIEAGGDTAAVAAILRRDDIVEQLVGILEPLGDWSGSDDEDLAGFSYFYVSTLADVYHHLYEKHLDGTEDETEGADEAEDSGEGGTPEEIAALLSGPMDASVPAEQVAAAFLAALREDAALARDESLSRQEQLRCLQHSAWRMSYFVPWIEGRNGGEAVAALLAPHREELDELYAQIGPIRQLTELEGDEELAGIAYFYVSNMGEIFHIFYGESEE